MEFGAHLPAPERENEDPLRLIRTVVSNPEIEAVLAKADNFASSKRFDRAIAEYTKLLRSSEDLTQALEGRAATFQLKGDKKRALVDYCRIIVVAPNRIERDSARLQIAILTQGKVVSKPPPDTQAKAIPVPQTGDLQPRRRRNAIAPFTVQTKSGSNYLIKLVNVTNSKDQIWIFVRGGDPYSTKVPIGNYTLRVASGSSWYGRDELFGPDTRFFRLRGKKGAAVDESPVLEFKKERNRIVGKFLNFEGSINGNVEQETMTRSEFDAN